MSSQTVITGTGVWCSGWDATGDAHVISECQFDLEPQLCANACHWRWHVMAQVFESLSSQWETWLEFQAPGSCPTCISSEPVDGSYLLLCPSFSHSCCLALFPFQVSQIQKQLNSKRNKIWAISSILKQATQEISCYYKQNYRVFIWIHSTCVQR